MLLQFGESSKVCEDLHARFEHIHGWFEHKAKTCALQKRVLTLMDFLETSLVGLARSHDDHRNDDNEKSDTDLTPSYV